MLGTVGSALGAINLFLGVETPSIEARAAILGGMENRERPSKRRKVSASHVTSGLITIHSSDQLHQLLRFQQISSPEVETAIRSFTSFLSDIEESSDAKWKLAQLQILREYCDGQASVSHDQVDFPDLLKTWSYAVETNDAATQSAVPAAFAQFFQTTSSCLDFREFGLSLGHSLLKRDQTRLFDKGLSAPPSRGTLVSSCLNLLTQIVSFDGGALAGKVFARRDYLYRRLDGLLGQARGATSVDSYSENVNVRSAAAHFLLANLKYLDTQGKAEIITHGKTLFSLARSLVRDPPEEVLNTLSCLKTSILDDKTLSRQLKRRCFNSGILAQLVPLYEYSADLGAAERKPSTEIRNAVHELLLEICTSDKGVRLQESGWYPAGFDPDLISQGDEAIDLGLDSPYYVDDNNSGTTVTNGALASFAQTLKPEKDILQSQLLVAIFAAMPELVANYFSRKSKLIVPPGDDPIWRGQFAFLFSVIQIPVPKNCGWDGKLPAIPPPLSIVVESIIPRPLDRVAIMKCFQMNDMIMTVSAARVTTIALKKLESVLNTFRRRSIKTTIWKQAVDGLTSLVIQRIAPLSEVIAALQRLDKEQEQARNSVLECIASYHKTLPSMTFASKFDISPALATALAKHATEESPEDDTTPHDQIPHLLEIASLSTATKWWHGSSDSLTLACRLLQFAMSTHDPDIKDCSTTISRALLLRKGILNADTRAFDALLTSLDSTSKWKPPSEVFAFLDNCMLRTIQRPVVYTDMLAEAQEATSDKMDLSLLAVCVSEQWPFTMRRGSKSTIKAVARWIAKFFSALDAAGENGRVLKYLQEDMVKESEENKTAKEALPKAFEKSTKKPVLLFELKEKHVQNLSPSEAEDTSSPETSSISLESLFPPPPACPSSLAGLDRWSKADFESDAEVQRLSSLVRALISPDQEVRLQAYHTLQTIIHAVDQSTFAEKTGLYLLLSELSETTRLHNATDSATAPPSITAELALYLLPTILDPSSPSYRKANKFLLRDACWNIPSLLPYLLNNVLLAEPDGDDAPGSNAYAADVATLLTLFAHAIRTPVDMNLFRRSGVFPRLFAYYLAPACPKPVRKQVLHVVYNAVRIPGGADTLVTRAGVLEWLSVVRDMVDHSGHGATFGKVDQGLKGIVDELEQVVKRACDSVAIERWSKARPILKHTRAENIQAVPEPSGLEMGKE